MIIGFTILETKGHEESIITFLKTNVLLEYPNFAANIVKAGSGVNVYSRYLTQEMFNTATFPFKIIELAKNESIVISAVDFPLEIPFRGETLTILPTGYYKSRSSKFPKELFDFFIQEKLLVFINGYYNLRDLWILAKGLWDMNGFWFNDESWNY